MSRWRQAAVIVTGGLLAGSLNYHALVSVHVYLRLVSLAIGVFVGLLVYIGFGLLERRIRMGDASSAYHDGSWTGVRSPMRSSPGFWQVLRLGVAIYLGGATTELIDNALSLSWVAQDFSIGVGLIVGAVVASAMTARRSLGPNA